MHVYGKSVANKIEIYTWLFLALVVVLHGDGEVTLFESSNRCEDLTNSTNNLHYSSCYDASFCIAGITCLTLQNRKHTHPYLALMLGPASAI
jgi:hypothetical protein